VRESSDLSALADLSPNTVPLCVRQARPLSTTLGPSNVEPRKLTIAGKHEAQEEGRRGKTIYSERCAKQILYVIDLPAEVDRSKVSAILKDGILNIELPKAAHAKTVLIEPKTA
jgi:hypothetical protein